MKRDPPDYRRQDPTYSRGHIVLIDIHHLCKMFKVHRNTISSWIKRGKLYRGEDPLQQLLSVYNLLIEKGVINGS